MDRIPYEWSRYYNEPVDWVTYYGDLHHGVIVTPNDDDDIFFILSTSKMHSFNNIANHNRTVENLRKLAWEFKDHRMLRPLPELRDQQKDGGPVQMIPMPTDWNFSKMFIFGAGASAFSCFGDDAIRLKAFNMKPPLATELFELRFKTVYEKYTGVLKLIPDLSAKKMDVENVMERRWQRVRNEYSPVELARYINIQFYLRELTEEFSTQTERAFERESLYNLFADKLEQAISKKGKNRGCSLISFNYDTLLDNAVANYCSLDFSRMEGYIPVMEQPLMLIKPHGSWNWGWKIPNRLSNEQNADEFWNAKMTLEKIYFEILGDFEKMVQWKSWGTNKNYDKYNRGKHELNRDFLEVFPPGGTQAYFPALLVPLKDKDGFLMPYLHDERLRMGFEQMEDVFLIGWKGGEDLFLRQWKQHGKKLRRIVIVNPDFEGVKAELSNHLELENYELIHIKYFDDFVLNHLDNFLGNS